MGVLDVIIPRRCAVCRAIGESLCGVCRDGFVSCAPPVCERCGAPGPWPVRRCAECASRRLGFESARAALVYESRARAFVSSWKERGRRDLSAVAALLVASVVVRPDVDVITFVPGDRDRGLARGHVPAAGLARALGDLWELPVRGLLERRAGIKRQRDLPRKERRSNVARAFSAPGPAPATVCLVDDVYTTGATAAACSIVLRRAGARRVDVICLARAVR